MTVYSFDFIYFFTNVSTSLFYSFNYRKCFYADDMILYICKAKLTGSSVNIALTMNSEILTKKSPQYFIFSSMQTVTFFFPFPLSDLRLPQHVHLGWKRLVCLQGDSLALKEVLLFICPGQTAGPCLHLTYAGHMPKYVTLYTKVLTRHDIWRQCSV